MQSFLIEKVFIWLNKNRETRFWKNYWGGLCPPSPPQVSATAAALGKFWISRAQKRHRFRWLFTSLTAPQSGQFLTCPPWLHQCIKLLFLFQCPVQKLQQFSYYNGTRGFIVDTRWPFKLVVNASHDPRKNCSITFHFGEYGHYIYETKFDITENKLCCAMVVNVKPVNSNIREYFSCNRHLYIYQWISFS